MEIVLDTNFNNLNLPRVARPGFTDNFNAADGNLTYTTDLKPWVFASGSANPMWVRSSGKAVIGPTAPSSVAYVDGLSANGLLTQTIGSIGSARNAALVFRYVDASNYLYLKWTEGTGVYRCYKYLAGVTTQVFGTSTTSANGDVIEVTMSGSAISAKINGTAVGSATVTDFLTATKHGMEGSSTDRTASIDSIVFVPAGS
jgi:hypothetical protein